MPLISSSVISTVGLLLFAFLWFAPYTVAAEEHLSTSGDPIAIYREAGIDEKQEKRILSAASQYEKSEGQMAHELIGHLKKLKALSLSPDLNESAIEQTQEEINKIQNNMAMEKIHLLFAIRKVLTKEQRVKLVGLMQNRAHGDNMIDTSPAPAP